MNMEHRWNDTDKGTPNYTEKNVAESHFAHHKSHID